MTPSAPALCPEHHDISLTIPSVANTVFWHPAGGAITIVLVTSKMLTPTVCRALECGFLTGLGVVLAICGGTNGVDSIVWYVFAIVDAIANDPWSILQPVYNPPPMYTHAYRPLSTAIVKLLSAGFERDVAGLESMTIAHGLGLVAYGLAARYCLRAYQFKSLIATLASATSMLMPTVLFSAWTIPEFDMVGGAIILAAAGLLRRGHGIAASMFMLLAILTKETTAIIMWGWLLARAIPAWSSGNRRPARTAIGYLIVLVWAVWPILTVQPPVTHAYSLADGEFEWSKAIYLTFLNMNQVFYVLGPSGALLIALLSASRVKTSLVPPLLCTGILALLVLSPPAQHYNHYESIIFADWPWILAWTMTLSGALLLLMWRGAEEERVLALMLGAVFTGLLLGPILASFSRADLSARLYAPVVPVFHALAYRGAWTAIKHCDAEHLPRMLSRGLAGAAAFGILWHAVAGAVSGIQFLHARFPLEMNAKQELIARLQEDARQGDPCAWVYYTNRDQELAMEELTLLGDISPEQQGCTRLIQLSRTSVAPGGFFEQSTRLHGYDHRRVEEHSKAIEASLKERSPLPVTVHLYVQVARSQMDSEVNTMLNSDFEWATDRLPETDVGFFEQTIGMTLVQDTPLERLFRTTAGEVHRLESRYVRIPFWFFEIPQRLILGIPIVEPWEYSATRYSIQRNQNVPGTP